MANGLVDYEGKAFNPELNLDQMQQVAVNAFILRVTLPLLFDEGACPSILGTGTLFKSDDRYFIITASHIFKTDVNDLNSEDIDLTKVAYPTKLCGAQLLTLGSFSINRYKGEDKVDVAVIELKAPETIDTLNANWSFLDFGILKGVSSSAGKFIISGFLHEGAKFDGKDVSQSMLNLRTDPLHYTPEVKDPVPQFDRFFYLQERGEMLDGSINVIPSLKGMSGSSIWFCEDLADGEFWTPQRVLSVVAVQSSQAPKVWARGVDWAAVAAILDSSDLALRSPPSGVTPAASP